MTINEELKNLIESNPLGLASVDEDGNPHCIAVADVKVISKNQILVGDNFMNRTKENVSQNNKVSLVVWNKDWKKKCVGYGLDGTVEYHNIGKWVDLVKKIHKGFPAKGALLITVLQIRQLA